MDWFLYEWALRHERDIQFYGKKAEKFTFPLTHFMQLVSFYPLKRSENL